MIAATLVFPLLASVLVAAFGRREPRLASASILALLAIPLLSLLPGPAILPPSNAEGASPITPKILIALWLAGALPLLLGFAASSLRLRSWKKRSIILGTLTLPHGRSGELRMLPGLHGPVAAGIFHPTIYVPTAWTSWPQDTRSIVLAHETAHLARRDPLWRVFTSLACALHWYHPLVWWLARRQHLHAEYACDAHVLRSGVAPKIYASLLCDIAAPAPRPMPLGAAPIAGRSQLHGRVARIFHPRPGLSSPAAALLLATLGSTAIALSILRPAPAEKPRFFEEELRLRWSANPFPGN